MTLAEILRFLCTAGNPSVEFLKLLTGMDSAMFDNVRMIAHIDAKL